MSEVPAKYHREGGLEKVTFLPVFRGTYSPPAMYQVNNDSGRLSKTNVYWLNRWKPEPAGTDTLTSADDVAHFIAPIRKLAQEEAYALVLDGDDKVVNVIKHSKGQKTSATVSPWTLAGAIVATPKAKSVWFAHNHPSGNADPSASDRLMTRALNDVLDGSGVINNGHVVVGRGGHARGLDADGQRLATAPLPLLSDSCILTAHR